jgi:hypothetical protein
VEPSPRWTFARCLIAAVIVTACTGSDQPLDTPGTNLPMTREDAYQRQVYLDVAAIVEGMTRAHGEAVALLPK